MPARPEMFTEGRPSPCVSPSLGWAANVRCGASVPAGLVGSRVVRPIGPVVSKQNRLVFVRSGGREAVSPRLHAARLFE